LNDINICLGCGVKIFQIRCKEEITRELKDFFSALVKLIEEKEGSNSN
jgi:thiamine monophosphate synthase